MENLPQLENGYLRVANELFDAVLKFPFTKRQLLIVLAVIRKTYGYGKKSDDMSLSQIEEITGVARPHCSPTINDLAEMKVLLKRSGQYGQVIGLNKKYSEWEVLPKRSLLPKRSRSVTKTVTKVLPKRSIQKTTPKDNTKRHTAKKIIMSEDFKPKDRTYELITKAGISKSFADSLLDEFIFYWRERKEKRPGWDSTFLNHVKNRWATETPVVGYGAGAI